MKQNKNTANNTAKKQITMVTLIVALALAVYLNYRLSGLETRGLPVTETILGADEIPVTALEEGISVSLEGEQQDQKYYGEALFVSRDVSAYSGTYFAEARLQRTESRDEALDTLQKSLQNTELTDAEKAQLTAQMTATASAISMETTVESLVKSKGFADCIAFLSGDTVKVVVATGPDGLTAGEAVQIKEIVISTCAVPASGIVIVEIK